MEKITREMLRVTYEALSEKKAEDICILNIEDITTLADAFVIASGSNISQIHAMADEVDEKMGRSGYVLHQTEGYHAGNWILMDYGDVVIHLFDQESRSFYDIEHIWRDGKTVTME